MPGRRVPERQCVWNRRRDLERLPPGDAAERLANAQPCATAAAFVLAQDAGRRRTVVSSGEEAARAEHE